MPRRCRSAVVATFLIVGSHAWTAGAQPPASARDELVDVTGETAVEFGDLVFSQETGRLTVGLRIRNGAERPLLKPLRLQVTEVRSKLGDASPTEATIDFDSAIPPRGLPHGEATSDRTIVFALTADAAMQVDRMAGEILTMTFRVQGRLGTAQDAAPPRTRRPRARR